MLTEDGYRRLETRKARCARNESAVHMAHEVWRKSVRFQQELRRQLETCRTELLIRRKLGQNRLPYDRDATTVGRPGRGGRCDGCERPLRWTQMVMEMPRGDGPSWRLHADCFLLWDRIRRS
jgi:hypothetical protein